MPEVDAERMRIRERRDLCLRSLGQLNAKWSRRLVEIVKQSSVSNMYEYADWSTEDEGKLNNYLKLIKYGDNYKLFRGQPMYQDGLTLNFIANYWKIDAPIYLSISGAPRNSLGSPFWDIARVDDSEVENTSRMARA